jgi:hypothetical protein
MPDRAISTTENRDLMEFRLLWDQWTRVVQKSYHGHILFSPESYSVLREQLAHAISAVSKSSPQLSEVFEEAEMISEPWSDMTWLFRIDRSSRKSIYLQCLSVKKKLGVKKFELPVNRSFLVVALIGMIVPWFWEPLIRVINPKLLIFSINSLIESWSAIGVAGGLMVASTVAGIAVVNHARPS